MAHLAHYREAHPLPFVVTHWINLICMLLLILTGFYIHYPFVEGFMSVARGVHFFCAFAILVNLILRIILAFVIKSSPTGGTREVDTDYKNWLPQKDNRHQLGAWIKYYLFLKKDHPLGAKYGVPQKISYLAIPVFLIVIGFTGFCLYGPTTDWPLFSGFTELVGGLMVVRIIHYFLMWVFIIFTLIHVYLANIEGLAPTKLMFFRKEHGGLVYDPKAHTIVTEDHLDEPECKK